MLLAGALSHREPNGDAGIWVLGDGQTHRQRGSGTTKVGGRRGRVKIARDATNKDQKDNVNESVVREH